jgi:5'-3' exonuclease
MGIPSFYKHLIQTISGLTSKTRAVAPRVFGLDFNCAIYYCVRTLQQRQPYASAACADWEAALIRETVVYLDKLIAQVAPTETVLVCVDGVAPMAKLKQQRARRFKSALGAEEEARVVAAAKGIPYVAQDRWDTNAITPGTGFMQALTHALKEYASRSRLHVVIDGAEQSGEGEQKLMAWIRTHRPTDVVVYGLDADLIVLALLAHATLGTHIDLFREDTEFGGKVKTDSAGDTEYTYLNIKHLAESLFAEFSARGQDMRAFLLDYVGIVNLLGNDFIPHGLNGREIARSDIEEMLRIRQVRMRAPLVVDDGSGAYAYSCDSLYTLLSALVAERPDGEGLRVLHTYAQGDRDRRALAGMKDPVERALFLYNAEPRTWGADAALVRRGADGRWGLADDWESHYDRLALLGVAPTQAAREYLQALAWTLAYYAGRPVDMDWYYALPNPPRVATLLAALTPDLLVAPATARPLLQPIEQLAMVLPASSFHLVPTELRRLDALLPHAWPTAWALHSFARTQRWKCEPMIPMISATQIRDLIEQAYESAA